MAEGGKRHRQLERELESSSSVASQRLSFCGRVEKHVATGQQEARNGTAQPRVTFTGLCDNPIFSPRQHS